MYTTQEDIGKNKYKPQVYSTQESRLYSTQESIEEIENNPQVFPTQVSTEEIKNNPQVYTT